MAERRTPEQVRGEIRFERQELDAALAALSGDARRTARLAAVVLAAGLGSLLLWRLSHVLRRS